MYSKTIHKIWIIWIIICSLNQQLYGSQGQNDTDSWAILDDAIEEVNRSILIQQSQEQLQSVLTDPKVQREELYFLLNHRQQERGLPPLCAASDKRSSHKIAEDLARIRKEIESPKSTK